MAVIAAGGTALALGACAQEASDDALPDVATADFGEFAATTDYLSGVAQATEQQSYRMEVDMTMRGSAPGEESLEVGGQFMSGETDGELSSVVLDMEPMMEDVAPGELPDGDLTMTMITDAEHMYVQAPFFRTMADMALSEGATLDGLGPLGAVTDLDEDEWGRVDLDQLSMAEIAQTTGAQGVSTDVFLQMAADGDDVEDLGTDEIRGVETRGLGATATFRDMLQAQGVDSDDFLDQFPSAPEGIDGGQFDDLIDAVLGIEIPLEVWVDADDNVRRVTMSIDMSQMMRGIDDIDPTTAGPELSIEMTMDMFDYGDDSIEIEVPAESIDVTDEFLDLARTGGITGATGSSPLPS